jgi:hypothetical protein
MRTKVLCEGECRALAPDHETGSALIRIEP